MIFVSSACSNKKFIYDVVTDLASHGFHNIELSGGTQYYKNYENDLIHLQDKYNLQYLIHNYFPPPEDDFVINLASSDDTIYQKSLDQLRRAVDLSHRLNLKKFGFHAGFLVDIAAKKIGKRLETGTISNREKAMDRFCEGYMELQKEAGNIELYIENNVYSASNWDVFGECKPFLLLCNEDFIELQKRISFKLLLDIALLFVTSQTMDLNFNSELQSLVGKSDYLHLSDNDGRHDLNRSIAPHSHIGQQLHCLQLVNKTITLEIYQGLEATRQSLMNLSTLLVEQKET